MKFSAVAFSVVSLAAFAAAQSSGTETASAATPSVTSSFTPEQQKCYDACPADNVACQAGCLGLPAPSEDMVNTTTECMAKCEQGNGTESETAKYAACQQDCISKHFFSTPAGAAQTMSGSGTAAGGVKATGSAAAASASDAAASGSAAASGAADDKSGAAGLQVGGAFGGIIALAAAAFAL